MTDKKEKKLTEAEKSELIIEFDEFLEEADITDEIQNSMELFERVRDELFAKINYCASQKEMISNQIEEMNVVTEKAIKYRGIIDKAVENATELYYAVQSTGSVFNEMHDKLAQLAKNSDVLQTGDLLKILNRYDKYSVDETVFNKDLPADIEVDYN